MGSEMCIRDSHSTWCWGNNTEGQIGDGTSVPDTGETNWEYNHPSSPVAVSVPAGIEFAAISAGQDHTCAVATNGSLWCWGGHNRGQLGLGQICDDTGWLSPVDSDIPAWVNLSGQGSASAYVPLSDRDLDNDGHLSIFDRTPLGTPVCPQGQYLIVTDETCNDASPVHYFSVVCLQSRFIVKRVNVRQTTRQDNQNQVFCAGWKM